MSLGKSSVTIVEKEVMFRENVEVTPIIIMIIIGNQGRIINVSIVESQGIKQKTVGVGQETIVRIIINPIKTQTKIIMAIIAIIAPSNLMKKSFRMLSKKQYKKAEI
jgi:hypothetical protein